MDPVVGGLEIVLVLGREVRCPHRRPRRRIPHRTHPPGWPLPPSFQLLMSSGEMTRRVGLSPA